MRRVYIQHYVFHSAEPRGMALDLEAPSGETVKAALVAGDVVDEGVLVFPYVFSDFTV